MPRILTPTAAQAILARETAEVFLVCLTIEAGDTYRIVNNTESVVRLVGTHHPYPFEAVLPEDTDAVSAQVQIRIDNVDRQVARLIREFEGVPQVRIEVVLASSPDTVEVGPFDFSVLAADHDAMVITLNLGHEEDFLNQAVPAQTYTPTNSPGMFR